jgi:hypothetical protein
LAGDDHVRKPYEPARLEPYDILILDAAAILEQANPAAVGTVLHSLMTDFWSARVKLYRLRQPGGNDHYEWSPDDIRRLHYTKENPRFAKALKWWSDGEGRISLDRTRKHDAVRLAALARFVGNGRLYRRIVSDDVSQLSRDRESDEEDRLTLDRVFAPFDQRSLLRCYRYMHRAGLRGGFGPEFDIEEREAWQHAASRDPNDYDPDRLYLKYLRIRLSDLLAWASRRKLVRPDPWPTKGDGQVEQPNWQNAIDERLTGLIACRENWGSKEATAKELSEWFSDNFPLAKKKPSWKTIKNNFSNKIPGARER